MVLLPLIIFHLTKTSNLREKHPAGYFVNTPLSHNNSKSSIYPYKLPPNSSSSCFSIKVYQLLLKLTKACFSRGRLCQEEGRMDFQLTGKPGDKEGNSWMLTQLASLRDTMCFISRRQPWTPHMGSPPLKWVFSDRKFTEPQAIYWSIWVWSRSFFNNPSLKNNYFQ